MTTVRIALTVPTADGQGRRPSGNLEWKPSKRRAVDGEVILPSPFNSPVTDPPALATVDPTDADWAWVVTERISGGSPKHRYLAVPDSAEIIDYADLVAVDPATLDPLEEPEAAWWAAVEDLQTTAAPVASVNGQIGAVVLGATDVGAQPAGSYATTADLTTGLAGKQDAGDYATTTDLSDGLAAKQDTATLPADVAAHVADGSALDTALRAALVPHDAHVIDLCSAPYNVSPGDDITDELQAAINAIAATGQSGEVFFSKVGTYLLNGPQQTGTALTYAYSGQVLFPAVPFLGQAVPAIRLRGPVRPSSGVSTTGKPQGVILQSNATSGYALACVPAEAQWGWQWTAIMPILENVIVRVPDNPTCGGIDMQCAIRCKLDGVTVDTTGAWTFPTGTREAIVLPHYFNNGDVTLRDINVRGFPVGIKLSEHNVLDNVGVIGCATAFTSVGGGHANWFGYVDVEECPTVFDVTGPAMLINGHLDIENTFTSGPFASNTLIKASAGSLITGSLQLSITGAPPGGMGLVGSLSRQLDVSNVGQGVASGWRNLHPLDDFTRLQNVAVSGTTAPGQSWPTMTPWRTKSGGWVVSGKKLTGTATGSTNMALVPARNAGESRSVSANVTLAASGYNAAVIVGRPYDNDVALVVRLAGGNLTLSTGSVFTGSGTTLGTYAGITGGSTYTVTVEVFYGGGGAPQFVRVSLDGVVRITAGLSPTQQTAIARSTTYPYLEDGVSTLEATSAFSSFAVRPAAPPPAYVGLGTATLAAGTVTVADTRITASSVIRYWRTTAGGTLGQLSLSLSAGTGFTITSSSSTDTSTIQYEVVSY